MPYGGLIRPQTLGMNIAHTVDDWRSEFVDLTLEWEETVRDPIRLKEMDQNTPAPTPLAASARWFEKAESPRQEE